MNQPTPDQAPNEKLPFPLQDREQVLAICRRHWFYLWPTVALYSLIGLIPALAIGFALDAASLYKGVLEKTFWVLAAAYLIYWGVRTFLVWYRYKHDIWVVTTQRLIDSFKSSPFNLKVATADLVNVQDMTVERDGLLRTMFDYGDIICQTASEQQEFRLSGIPNPRETQALVDRERDRERAGQNPRTQL